jgi:hypothetical protein
LSSTGDSPAPNETKPTSEATSPTTSKTKAEEADGTAENASTTETAAAATPSPEIPKALGSKVMTTTLICLAAAIAGIAAMSVFLVKT